MLSNIAYGGKLGVCAARVDRVRPGEVIRGAWSVPSAPTLSPITYPAIGSAYHAEDDVGLAAHALHHARDGRVCRRLARPARRDGRKTGRHREEREHVCVGSSTLRREGGRGSGGVTHASRGRSGRLRGRAASEDGCVFEPNEPVSVAGLSVIPVALSRRTKWCLQVQIGFRDAGRLFSSQN